MHYIHNVLNLILDGNKYNAICFLCLKNQSKTTSIYSMIEVIGDSYKLSLSLANMMKKMFPKHEILCHQACEDCTNLIMKMFITLHKYENNISTLNLIINNLDIQLQDINPITKDKVFMLINRPLNEDLLKENKSKLLNNTQNETFHCKICFMKFNSINLLQEHKRTLHKNTNKATICDICGHTFKTPNALKAHINCHKEKECPYCFKVLKSHSHYNIHLKSHKTGFKRKRNKIFHSCSNCDYQTLNKKTLEAHINKIHLHIRPYVCQICYKGFYKKSNLTEHASTHIQTKNKTCEFCGDNFVNDKTLIEHQRLHSNTKPYECKICGKKFVTSGRRSDHIKRSHMEKTECCLFCDKKFSLGKELNRHVKKIHTENPLTISNNFEISISNYKFVDTMVLPIT